MQLTAAVTLLTGYRNGTLDVSDLEVAQARRIVEEAGYEWQHGYDASLGGGPLGWRLVKPSGDRQLETLRLLAVWSSGVVGAACLVIEYVIN